MLLHLSISQWQCSFQMKCILLSLTHYTLVMQKCISDLYELQIMAYCLMAPSHLNQRCLSLWQVSKQGPDEYVPCINAPHISHKDEHEKWYFTNDLHCYTGSQWVKRCHIVLVVQSPGPCLVVRSLLLSECITAHEWPWNSHTQWQMSWLMFSARWDHPIRPVMQGITENPHNRHPIAHPLGWAMGCL